MKCGSDKDRGANRSSPERTEYDPEGAGRGPACVGPGGLQMGAGRRVPGHLPAGAPGGCFGAGVLDLLRGEQGTVPEPEPTIRQALAFLARQAKERTRRKWSQVLGGTCALLMAGFVLFAILDRAGVFLQEISLEVPATVYSAEGVSAGETTVAIDGSVKILGDRSFEGQFAIHEVETTYREGVHANIRWDAMWTGAQDILFYRAGEFCTLGVERMLYITENMQSFGLRLEDGTIITTDEAYVPLLMSGYYYSIRPIFSNQF